MKRPAVGDVVRYVYRGVRCYPAIITSMGEKLDYENKDRMIDCLRVFTDIDDENNGQFLARNVVYVKPFVRKWGWVGRLKFSKDCKEGTWHYAEDWKKSEVYGGVKGREAVSSVVSDAANVAGNVAGWPLLSPSLSLLHRAYNNGRVRKLRYWVKRMWGK